VTDHLAGMEVWINCRNFPINLWHLVTDPQICSICWDDTGEGILICHNQQADKQVLQNNKFHQFCSPANLYSFRKVCPDYMISLEQVSFIQRFYNPNFNWANPELLVNLKRLNGASQLHTALLQPEHQMV
ncbi:MAG: hypothetical protein ACRCVL_03840, partial [Cetobacterium sp.]